MDWEGNFKRWWNICTHLSTLFFIFYFLARILDRFCGTVMTEILTVTFEIALFIIFAGLGITRLVIYFIEKSQGKNTKSENEKTTKSIGEFNKEVKKGLEKIAKRKSHFGKM